MYLQCIANAHRSLWLTTPYFAVEDSMVRALCMAAGSGVAVLPLTEAAEIAHVLVGHVHSAGVGVLAVHAQDLPVVPVVQEKLGRELPNWQRASRLLTCRGFLLYRDTASTYFPTGAAFFEDAIRRRDARCQLGSSRPSFS